MCPWAIFWRPLRRFETAPNCLEALGVENEPRPYKKDPLGSFSEGPAGRPRNPQNGQEALGAERELESAKIEKRYILSKFYGRGHGLSVYPSLEDKPEAAYRL